MLTIVADVESCSFELINKSSVSSQTCSHLSAVKSKFYWDQFLVTSS